MAIFHISRARIHWQQSIGAEEAETDLIPWRPTVRCWYAGVKALSPMMRCGEKWDYGSEL